MITSDTYSRLTIEEKIEVLWNRGRFLLANRLKTFDRSLYGLDGFFVEVFYYKNNENIKDIKLVRNLKTLDVYIKQINITSLLNV